MNLIRRIFDCKGTPLLVGVFLVLFIMEGRRQLRKRQVPRWKRVLINSIVSLPAFSLLRFLFLPAMIRLADKNGQWQWGLNYQYEAPQFMKWMAAFLIMDYGNYIWHILNHKIPFLWRFHLVHHCDPDLDVTTAIRFHFGELIGSVFSRGAFVFLAGATPLQVLVYEVLFEGATQFHHSNWKLPYRLEKALNRVIVTPRMHGIHHSMVKREMDSNYSVIFSFWDRLHHTVRLNVAQDTIVIGVPAYSDPHELTIGYLLKLPFTKIRKWNPVSETEAGRETIPGKNNLAE